MNNDRADLASEIALNSDGQAPAWIELFPAGPDIVGRDGRRWTISAPEAFAAAFNSAGQPVPLDWEHASHHKALKGERADAAGWIEELEARNGAIWGRVEWTEDGKGSVSSRAYRFVSPSFLFSKTREVARLVHAGLTNQPNLTLTALNSQEYKDNDPMSLKPITDALGLVDGASHDQITAAINTLKTERETALNSTLKPDPEKYIPAAEHELALNKIETFEEAAKAQADAEIEATVDALIGAGDPNHPPAKRDDYIAICNAEGGLDRFKRLYKADLGKALNKREVSGRSAPGAGKSTLSDDERIAINQLGMSEEDFLKEKGAQ